MSVTGNSGIGIPILVLHDALGGEITIELKDGCSYTGMLDDVQDNMNCTLKGPLTRTNEEGETSELDMTFVRGSQIRFIVLPHILKEAPYFQRIHKWRKYKGSFLYGVGGGKTPGPGMGGMGGLNPMGIPGMDISMGLSMGIGMGGGPTMGPPPGQMQVSFGGQQFGPPPGYIPPMSMSHPRGPPPGQAGAMGAMPMTGGSLPNLDGPPPGYQQGMMMHRGPPPGYPGGPAPGAGQFQPPPPPPPPPGAP